MTQSFWESEVEEQAQPELPLPPPAPQAAETAPAVITADDFSALEERILRAVTLVKRERQARAAAEQRAQLAEEQLCAHVPQLDRLQSELNALRAERDQVRQRVERLLSQLDALEL